MIDAHRPESLRFAELTGRKPDGEYDLPRDKPTFYILGVPFAGAITANYTHGFMERARSVLGTMKLGTEVVQ